MQAVMRNFLRDLESAWWRFIKPEFDEPDYDDVSTTARRQWVAGHRHPDTCDGSDNCGCAS